MQRRTLLRSLIAALAATPLSRLKVFAQAPPISDSDAATLAAIAEVVFPTSLGNDGRSKIVSGFIAWVRNYREGAEMGHGYGSSTLRSPSGPSPASRYRPQFAALDTAAKSRGASSFSALDPAGRLAIVEAFLNEPQPVTRLPAQPNGQNLIADFMAFYFTSAEAWDLAYRAEIGRDRCRTLDGSDQPPAAVQRGTNQPPPRRKGVRGDEVPRVKNDLRI